MNDLILEYKGYQVKPDKQFPSHLIIVTSGRGGKIPDVLSGLFTSRRVAMNEIDAYLITKTKGKQDDETNN